MPQRAARIKPCGPCSWRKSPLRAFRNEHARADLAVDQLVAPENSVPPNPSSKRRVQTDGEAPPPGVDANERAVEIVEIPPRRRKERLVQALLGREDQRQTLEVVEVFARTSSNSSRKRRSAQRPQRLSRS